MHWIHADGGTKNYKAHKAYRLAESESLILNFDDTTKFQKKLGGVAINQMVLCLNEVSDGSAKSMIEQISLELENFHYIAHALNLHNPQINWTLYILHIQLSID